MEYSYNYRYSDFILECNSLDENKKNLKLSNDVLLSLIEVLPNESEYLFWLSDEVIKISQTLEQGEMITDHLLETINFIEDLIYSYLGPLDDDLSLISNETFNFEKLKKNLQKKLKHPRYIIFDKFEVDQAALYNLIKKNEKWHDFTRDISLYEERQKGKYLNELGNQFRMSKSTISMAIKKVEGAINFYKGKLFEDFVYKLLKDSNLFKMVIKEAGKGECDIRAYTKKNILFIYSLKNLKIDYSPYWIITTEELRPELEMAVLSKLDQETHLILLIYNNFNESIKQFEIDYNNTKNINISR